MVSTYPSQKLPSTAVCEAIGNIFSKLSQAHKAYAEAADGLAQMSTKISPEHYTLLLMAVTAPPIQLALPPGITSPVAAPLPPPHQATTPLGRAAIIDATKQKVLPDPNASCLSECNKNTATRVLAVAIYSKLEKNNTLTALTPEWKSAQLFTAMFHNLPRPSLGLNIIQALITINQNPGSHTKEPRTKVKHQIQHSLRRPGLHQARKPVRNPNHGRRNTQRHFHCET